MSDCNKSTIDAIVKNYLLSRGYEKAAAEMEIELHRMKEENADNLTSGVSQNDWRKVAIGSASIINPNDALQLSSQVLSSVIEDIVILGANSGNHRIYEEEYTALRSWSLTSLDIVKSEVLLLLLPTFVHW
jgi:WD40 associated region in TFIID subunit, NTD2 domain